MALLKNYNVYYLPKISKQLHNAVVPLHQGNHEASLLAHPLAPRVRDREVQDAVLEHL